MQKAVKNLGNLLVLAAIAVAIYVAAKVVPFYVDNMDVQEAVDAAFNLARRNSNDGLLRAEIRSAPGDGTEVRLMLPASTREAVGAMKETTR